MAVLLGAAGLVLMAILGIVCFSRDRAVRRFNAAMNAYAHRELARERRRMETRRQERSPAS
jgi:hypothetical protein